jgi:hypothetical protein
MKTRIVGTLAAGAVMMMALAVQAAEGQKTPYTAQGLFVEGCSCAPICTCELIEVEMGCKGVGAYSLTGGQFNGVSLAGAKLAYAVSPGHWLYLYVDSPDPKQREAALEFAKAYYHEWGELKSARQAHIKIEGSEGRYTVTVDDGKVMTLKTEPILGGDGKTAVQISNTKSGLNPTVSQGRTLSGEFHDGEESFELKDSNSFFNPHMNAKGSV